MLYVTRQTDTRSMVSLAWETRLTDLRYSTLFQMCTYIYIYRNRSTRRCLCADGNEPREISLSPESRVASKAVRARGDDSINGGEHPSSIQGVNIYPMAGDLGGGGKGRRAAG